MFSSHPLFRIFRVVLLFSYQVSLTSYQVFAVRSLVRQRDIYYHTVKSLSTTYRQQELVYQFVAIMSTIFLNFIAFFYKFILYSISIYNSHSLLQYIDVFLFHFIL